MDEIGGKTRSELIAVGSQTLTQLLDNNMWKAYVHEAYVWVVKSQYIHKTTPYDKNPDNTRAESLRYIAVACRHVKNRQHYMERPFQYLEDVDHASTEEEPRRWQRDLAELKEISRTSDKEASDIFFRLYNMNDYNNMNKTDNTLDLHRQTKWEAKERLSSFLSDVREKSCCKDVIVITGKGKHSPNGRGVLKGHMLMFLTMWKVKFEDNMPNEGCIIVRINQDVLHYNMEAAAGAGKFGELQTNIRQTAHDRMTCNPGPGGCCNDDSGWNTVVYRRRCRRDTALGTAMQALPVVRKSYSPLATASHRSSELKPDVVERRQHLRLPQIKVT